MCLVCFNCILRIHTNRNLLNYNYLGKNQGAINFVNDTVTVSGNTLYGVFKIEG